MNLYKIPLPHKATYLSWQEKISIRNKCRHEEVLIELYLQEYLEIYTLFSNKHLRRSMYKAFNLLPPYRCLSVSTKVI